jgi:hypothetical protein
MVHNTDWSIAGLHVYKAMTAGRHFNMLALASICAILVLMDGPLLQRASTVRNEIPTGSMPLAVKIAPEVPGYSTGWVDAGSESNSNGGTQTAINPRKEFLPILEAYAASSPMTGAVTGCRDTCSATIQAPALQVESCRTEMHFVNFSQPLTGPNAKLYNMTYSAPSSRDVFQVGFNVFNGSSERLSFETRIATNQALVKHGGTWCAGQVNTTSCNLTSSIAEYPIIIQNDIITFAEPPSYPKIIATANNTAITAQTITQPGRVNLDWPSLVYSTLAGIAAAAGIEYAYEAYLFPVSAGQGILEGASSWFLFKHMKNFTAFLENDVCSPFWRDPRDEIMASLNEYVFSV